MTRLLYRTGRWAAAAPLAHPRRLAPRHRLRPRARRRLRRRPAGQLERPRRRVPGRARPAPRARPGRRQRLRPRGRARRGRHRPSRRPGRARRPAAGRCRTPSTVSAPRFSDDGDTALLLVGYDVEVTHPDLMGELDAARGGRRAHPRRRAPGRAQRRAARDRRRPDEGPRRAHRHRRRAAHPGARVRLRRRRRACRSVSPSPGSPSAPAGWPLLAGVMDVSTAAPTVATMVGLGVGIDYALLLVTRHVEYLRAGPRRASRPPRRAAATAGRSVVFAGGDRAGLPAGAPARRAVDVLLLRLRHRDRRGQRAGRRAAPWCRRSAGSPAAGCCPARYAAAATSTGTPLTARWAARVGRRPLPWAIGAAAFMVLLALPALDMRTWPQDAEQPVGRADHPARLRPGLRRSTARAPTAP